MSRSISASLLTALSSDVCEPFYAVELFFDSSTLRLWSGVGNKDINTGSTQTFTGTGSLLSIGPTDETGDLSAKSMSVSLTGLDSSIISLALQEPYQRRQAKVFMGEQSVSDVVQIFSGQMNTMNIVDAAESSTVELIIESKLVELERAANWRYTDENHQSRQDGDTFFSYVQAIQDVSVAWGRSAD